MGRSRIEFEQTNLRCNERECGHEFVGPWPYVVTVSQRTTDRAPGRDGGDDLKCPSCGSDRIRRAGRFDRQAR